MSQLTYSAVDHWQVLQQETDSRSFITAWLALMGERVGEVQEAVVVMGPANVGPFRPVALWPGSRSTCSPELAVACEQAMELRLPVNRADRQGSILVVPLLRDQDIHGVIGIQFLAPNVPFHARNWVMWGVGWIYDRLLHTTEPADQPLPERLLVFLNLLLSVLAVEKFEAACQTAVTESATRLGCDRAALGLGGRNRVRLIALSHAAEVVQQVDLTHRLEAAMNEAADQGCALTYVEGEAATVDEGSPPRPTRELMLLARQFGNRAVMATPFFISEEAYGVFLFEWLDAELDPTTRQMAEGIPPILGRVLLDKRAQQLPWYKRLRKALRDQLHRLLGPRHAGYKLFVLTALSASIFFYQAHGEHNVTAHAALEGGIRRLIVAPYDGFIATAQVRAGHLVRAGEAMATLDDRDMRLEAARWSSQQRQYQQQAHEAEAKHDLAQIQIIGAQIRQAEAQRALLETMIQRASVVAPFDGVVTSGDLSQHLGGAVKKGQTLFEIAPLDSYRVVLEIAESDIASVESGQTGGLVVTAIPGVIFPFTLSLVTPVASVSEGQTVFRAEALLQNSDERLRPGMDGVAKVLIGERRLIWIWTHRLTDWLRLQLWQRFGI
ncbi:MAG: efflux RND transporter periplasmic adaptor subunit [Magnetococcales bacterium]|nr:efflux RND transporter periplasmic adaptor subunit [Magnetococcales bacterium]